MNNNNKDTIKERRDTLKLLGTAWVTPTIISATIPAHAQTSGLFCGGMNTLAGDWIFLLTEIPDTFGVTLSADGKANDGTWSLNGSEISIFDVNGKTGLAYKGSVDSGCSAISGIEVDTKEPFQANKYLDAPT